MDPTPGANRISLISSIWSCFNIFYLILFWSSPREPSGLEKNKKTEGFLHFSWNDLGKSPVATAASILGWGGEVVADLYFLHIFYLIPLMFLGHQNPVIYRVWHQFNRFWCFEFVSRTILLTRKKFGLMGPKTGKNPFREDLLRWQFLLYDPSLRDPPNLHLLFILIVEYLLF